MSVILYIFGFAVSWGPVVWLVCSEIFPLEGREIGMTITTMVNWTFAGLVMANALSFMQAHGNASIFYVFAGFCLLAVAFVAFLCRRRRGSLSKRWSSTSRTAFDFETWAIASWDTKSAPPGYSSQSDLHCLAICPEEEFTSTFHNHKYLTLWKSQSMWVKMLGLFGHWGMAVRDSGSKSQN